MMKMREVTRRRGAMVLMGWRWVIAGVVGVMLCGCGEKKGEEIETKAAAKEVREPVRMMSSFRVKMEKRSEEAFLSSDALVWANESMVLATSGGKGVQAFDVKSGEEVWKVEFDDRVAAIACSERHVYVALISFTPTREREWLRRLEMATGKDDTPPAIPQPGVVLALGWSEDLGQLCVVESKDVSLYTHDLMSVKRRIRYDAKPLHASMDGGSLLLTRPEGDCDVVDVKAGTVESVYKPSITERSKAESTNGPKLQDAFLDAKEGRLIRNVDKRKGEARLFFHESRGSMAREVDTGMDHVKAAVHWPTQRLAAAGSHLMLFSTKGDLVEDVKGEVYEEVEDAMSNVVSVGVAGVAFSPSGKRLAVLDWKGWVKVYEVR